MSESNVPIFVRPRCLRIRSRWLFLLVDLRMLLSILRGSVEALKINIWRDVYSFSA